MITNKSELISNNKHIVELVAKQYLNHSLSLEQLIREGNKGLTYAADHYEANKGYPFSNYASWLVRMSILQALAAIANGDSIPPVFVPRKNLSK
jgi:RNA polymerase primary sigma factor